MIPKIGLVTIWTNNIAEMKNFYGNIMGFPVEYDSETYIEFETPNVRFAICKRSVMSRLTKHASYKEAFKGQAFELAFPCKTSEDVVETYKELKSKGVKFITEPEMMEWERMTACFIDPEGNIHEIYSLKDGEL